MLGENRASGNGENINKNLLCYIKNGVASRTQYNIGDGPNGRQKHISTRWKCQYHIEVIPLKLEKVLYWKG